MDDMVPYRLPKRLLDSSVAAVLFVLLSPVFVIAVVVLALDKLLVRGDRGSWLYRERRISRGREFELIKFRVLNKQALAALAARDGAYARLYEREESNLTRAGRVLKRVYLDELPQLVNVLRGDMSLVGPR